MYKEILLIDDDAVTNFLNQDLIEHKYPKATVIIFYNGFDALQYIMEHAEKEFIVFLDLNMPVMDGWEFLELLEARIEGREIAIHVLSSSINPLDKVRASECSLVDSFIEKPLDENLLDGLLIESIKRTK